MTFWQLLLGRGCSHRFSWPCIDTDGRHYQTCLLCGTAFEYDWTMMRRTGRLMVMDVQHRDVAVSGNQAPICYFVARISPTTGS
jgi:hypothetical protein